MLLLSANKGGYQCQLKHIEKERLRTVSRCYRGEDESVTRIISARKAAKYEEELYGGVL